MTIIEENQDSSLAITTMETQKLEKEPEKQLYRKVHYKFLVFIFIQTCWFFTFSIAVTPLWGGNALFPVQNDDIMSRTARLIMIYHSLAVPFLVANTFWIMEFFHNNIREKYIPHLKVTLLPGALLTGIFGILFAYTRYRIFHEIFYFGLFLVFMGGIIYVIAAFPIPYKFPVPDDNDAPTIRGLNLENVSLVILAVCILISAIYGALAAIENFTGDVTGLGREPIAFLAEEIVRDDHDWVQDFIVSHLHIQLAQSTAMVVMIGYRLSALRGYIYKVVLFFNPIGVLVISLGAWSLNHYSIWVGAGILLLTTLVMTIAGWVKASMDYLGDDYMRASKLKKIKAVFGDPLQFVLYFLFFFSNFTVTISGIIAGLRTETVLRTHEYVIIEYSFNVGHWHILAVLLGLILLVVAVDYYDVQGKGRKVFAYSMLIGYIIAFTAVNIYMQRFPPAEIVQPWLFITLTGVIILFLSTVFGMILLTKKVMEDRKELKVERHLVV